MVFSGQLDIIQEELTVFSNNFPSTSTNEKHIHGHIFAINACLSSLKGDQLKALKHSQGALTLLPEDDFFARGISSLTLGLSLRWRGDLAAAVDAYTIAQQVSKKGEDSFVYIYSSCFKGYVKVLQGKLKEGYEEYISALASFQRNDDGKWVSPILGLIYSFLSGVLLRWNKVDQSMEHAQKGLELSKIWGNKQAIQDGYFFYIQALIARGDFSGAKRAINQAKENADSLPPFQGLDVFFQEGLLHIKLSNLDYVTKLIQEIDIHPDDEIGYIQLQTYQVLAKYLRQSGDIEQAAQLLNRLVQIAKQAGARSKELEVYIQLALVFWMREDASQALASLEPALEIAEPEGNLYAFLNDGQPLVDLLKYAASKGVYVDYIGKILAAYNTSIHFNDEHYLDGDDISVPPLSEREKQVLRLLAVGLTSTEVAKELVISVSTARTHIKNLYRKLDVHKRIEAINKAKELALI
jgi:LuxR family maltose regulon positive regulatory protein